MVFFDLKLLEAKSKPNRKYYFLSKLFLSPITWAISLVLQYVLKKIYIIYIFRIYFIEI